MKIRILVVIAFSVSCCSEKEKYVRLDRTLGLYSRDCYNQVEFICLNSDYTYEYFVKNRSEKELLVKDKWNFTQMNGKSIIALNGFNYSISLRKYLKNKGGYSIPVKYSFKKKVILLRMDADDHSRDFVRIDSLSCGN